MHGNGPRALLIAADRLQGNTQKRCHLFLGLFQAGLDDGYLVHVDQDRIVGWRVGQGIDYR